MSQRCEITGAEPRAGNNVSHAKNHTRRRWIPNIKKKRIFLVSENKYVTVKLTAKALKTITKRGLVI